EIEADEAGNPTTIATIPDGPALMCGTTDWKSEYKVGQGQALTEYMDWKVPCAKITPGDPFLSTVLGRSLRDLHMLQYPSPLGVSIAAGFPWYNALFGRDPQVTALQWLAFFPSVARGVVRVNGSLQGESDDEGTDRRRGKIHHERHV